MLRASFKAYGGTDMLNQLDIDETMRPQELDIIDFCRIADYLAPQLSQ